MGDGTPPIESGPPPSFVSAVLGVLTSPGPTFAGILRKPSFWAPLLGILVINLTFTGIWLNKVDPGEFMKAQMIESGQWDKIPAESRQQIVDTQSKMIPIFGWVGGILGAPIFLALMAGVLLFIYRFFYAGQVTFKQSATLVAYVSIAYGLVVTPLMLLILFLKGDWNLNPQDVVQANATLFLDHETVSKALWAFAGSMDLFIFWQIWLLATAFGVATGRKTSSALWGVVIPWGLIVLIKVTFKLFF
ncbi:MAG: YIP1 family protein [Vicinamibacteria bacterium]